MIVINFFCRKYSNIGDENNLLQMTFCCTYIMTKLKKIPLQICHTGYSLVSGMIAIAHLGRNLKLVATRCQLRWNHGLLKKICCNWYQQLRQTLKLAANSHSQQLCCDKFVTNHYFQCKWAFVTKRAIFCDESCSLQLTNNPIFL